jgi:hypothetical protein
MKAPLGCVDSTGRYLVHHREGHVVDGWLIWFQATQHGLWNKRGLPKNWEVA